LRRQLAFYRLAAGVLNLETDKRRASRFFFQAWQARPERLDLLCLAGLSFFVLPFLPTAGLVRWLKRARGYS
jgi:hypothetical protein